MNNSIIKIGLKKCSIHLQSAQNRLHLKNGRVVNHDQTIDTDIYIEDGIIKQIGTNLVVPGGTRVIDCRGKLILPGGVDPAVSLSHSFGSASDASVSLDDYYTGTKAALAGCTTFIVDTVKAKQGESLLSAFDEKLAALTKFACCDFALRVVISAWNEQVARDVETLCKEKGVNTLDVSLAPDDPHEAPLTDGQLYELFRKARQLGALVRVHCENGPVIRARAKELLEEGVSGVEGHLLSRPAELECDTIAHVSTIAAAALCPIVVAAVSSRSSANAVGAARLVGPAGRVVFGELALAPLVQDFGSRFTDAEHSKEAALALTAPPMRPDAAAPDFLLKLATSSELWSVASEHLPFSAEQKEAGLKKDFTQVPPGAPGVEHRFPLLWQLAVQPGVTDACGFVALTSTNAAKQYNLYPRKGHVALNSDADLVVFDPLAAPRAISCSKPASIIADAPPLPNILPQYGAADYSLYEGLHVRGAPVFIIIGGHVVFEDAELKVGQGSGEFVPLPCFSEHVYNRIDAMLKTQRSVQVEHTAEVINSVEAPALLETSLKRLSINSSDGQVAVAVADENKKPSPSPMATPAPQTPASPQSPFTPTSPNAGTMQSPVSPSGGAKDPNSGPGFHVRPPTRAGTRNQQDSSFSLSGAQVDDNKPYRPSIKTNAPKQPTNLW